jgi:hypothetical protein
MLLTRVCSTRWVSCCGVYYPGNRVADTGEGLAVARGCLIVRWQSGIGVSEIVTRQSTADKLPAFKNHLDSSE